MRRSLDSKLSIPLGLHVLGLPLAFILSQDQTLHCMFVCPYAQLNLKLTLWFFFLTWLLYCYVNELRSVRILRNLNLSSCSWFASAKVISFSETTKTFLKFFFHNPKVVLICFLTALLRFLLFRFGTAKVENVFRTTKTFFKFFLANLIAWIRFSFSWTPALPDLSIWDCKDSLYFLSRKTFIQKYSIGNIFLSNIVIFVY